MTTEYKDVRLIDFGDLQGKQDRTMAFAVNKSKRWTNEEIAYIAANMFDKSIDDIAIHLGRTASAIWSIYSKDEEFRALREENGAHIVKRNYSGKVESSNRDNRVVTSDADVLFNFGD